MILFYTITGAYKRLKVGRYFDDKYVYLFILDEKDDNHFWYNYYHIFIKFH